MSAVVKFESIIEKLMVLLQGNTLATFAMESGFVQRTPRKIDPNNILIALFIRVLQGVHSLSSIATTIGLLKGLRISKQGISKRMNESLLRYLERVLAYTIAHKLPPCYRMFSSRFSRILLHDSTTVQLPSRLATAFPGSRNGMKKDIALVKIQAVYDVLREQCSWFWMSPFTTNDQSVATMLEYVQRGDLVIRDLGYFVISALALLQQKGAFFLTRLRHGIIVSNPQSGKRIELLKMLKKHKNTRYVRVGRNERTTEGSLSCSPG